MISKLAYYFLSVFTLARNVKNWRVIVSLLARPSGQEKIVKLRNGLQFYVRSLMDVWIIKETCLDLDYEFDEFRGGTIIDIGAGLGDYAIYKAFTDPTSRVYAIEPFKESFELLVKNISLNQVSNIQKSPIAIGGRSGELLLADTGEAVQHTTTKCDTGGVRTNVVPVESLSLNDYFKTHAIESCQYLKMDCEGSEFEILLNSPPDIFRKIERIGLEFHDGYTQFDHTDLVQLLETNNFDVVVKPNPVHGFLGFIFAKRKD